MTPLDQDKIGNTSWMKLQIYICYMPFIHGSMDLRLGGFPNSKSFQVFSVSSKNTEGLSLGLDVVLV